MKLLGIDLDGTLLRHDKTIAPADRAALEAAQKAGVVVTLVTGRLLSSTLSVAQDLGLEGLLVCADGGLVVNTQGEVLERFPMARADVAHAVRVADEAQLGGFALLDDSIHFDEGAAEHAQYAAGWTPNLRRHDRLATSEAATGEVLGFIAFGTERAVAAAQASVVANCSATSALTFSLGESHALKLTPSHVDKATGLRAVAERLQVAQAEVVAVGDWLNDIAMLQWAGQSFAMGGAPAKVTAAAKHTLRAQAHEGGGIAELVERMLSTL